MSLANGPSKGNGALRKNLSELAETRAAMEKEIGSALASAAAVARQVDDTIADTTKLRKQAHSARGTALSESERDQAKLDIASGLFSTTLDLQHMMELVVKKLCAILRTEACSIFTVRGKTGYLDYWGNNKKLKELSAKNMFRVKQGIVGQVIAEGKTRVVEDAAINNDVDASIDEQTGFVTESIVTCPIFGNNEECIGAVQLLNYKDEAPFEPADIELLKEFILYCSGAIQQSLRFSEMQDEMTKYKKVSEASDKIYSSEADVNTTIANSMELFRKLINADRCTVFLYDSKHDVLWTNKKLADGIEDRIEIPVGAGLAGACFQSKTVLRIDDAYEDKRFNVATDQSTGYKTKAVLCVPILSKTGACEGVAEMMNKNDESGLFTNEDVALCQSFARHIRFAVHSAHKSAQAKRAEAKSKSLLEVSTLISQEMNTELLLSSVMDLSRPLLQADRCTVFLLDEDTNELWSKIASEHKEIRMPANTGIAGHVVSTGTTVNIKDCYEDPRFNKEIDMKSGYRTRSLLCMPIIESNSGKILGATQMINKLDGSFFSDEDEEMLRAITVHVAVAMTNASLYEVAQKQQRRSEALLEVIEATISWKDDDIYLVIEKILQAATKVLYADRGTMFLVDHLKNELYCKIGREIKGLSFPIGQGIAGQVAAENITINIEDAYLDGRFDQKFDKKTGYRTRHILCAPIMDSAENVCAVIQLLNKKTGSPFNAEDMSLLELMANRIGEVINSKAVEAAYNAMMSNDEEAGEEARNFLAMYSRRGSLPYTGNALVSRRGSSARRGSISSSPLKKRANSKDEGSSGSQELAASMKLLKSWDFDIYTHMHGESVDLALNIFQGLKLVDGLLLREAHVHAFLEKVSINYLDNPYHNFQHGFSVMHAVFMVINSTKLLDWLDEQEIFSMLVAAYCHDVGHDGVNNTFHVASGSELALTYNDNSVLENMHASTLFRVASLAGCNIFSSLDKAAYIRVRKRIISMILATDMAGHIELTTQLQETLTKEKYNKEDGKHRLLLMDAVVHASDVSNPVLPEKLSRAWSDRVVKEFNAQVAREKKLSLPVSTFMDVKVGTAGQAKLNVGFIDYVVYPLWNILSSFLDGIEDRVETCKANRQAWKDMEAEMRAEEEKSAAKAEEGAAQ